MIRHPENFPQQVKEVQRQLGLSPEDLLRSFGVSFATVNPWENGTRLPSKLAIKQCTTMCATNTRSGKLNFDNRDATP